MPTYEEYVLELGDLARERLWNKPACPKSIDRVYKAEEQLSQRQGEAKDIEEQIAEQDQALTEFREACDAEFAEHEVVVTKFKKSVDAAEGKVKGLRSKIAGKEADLRYSKLSMSKEEERVKNWEETGEGEKAVAGKENLKRLRLDLLRRQKEITELREDMDKIMNPETGIGAEGIRARRRIMDLEDQLTVREEDYERVVAELQDQLAAKQDEVNAAQEYYDKSIAILGEDVYKARIPDPALSAIYPKLDRLTK
jgi:chromosome segregation ATPase